MRVWNVNAFGKVLHHGTEHSGTIRSINVVRIFNGWHSRQWTRGLCDLRNGNGKSEAGNQKQGEETSRGRFHTGDILHGVTQQNGSTMAIDCPLLVRRGGRDIKRDIAKLPLMPRKFFDLEPPPRLWPQGRYRVFFLVPETPLLARRGNTSSGVRFDSQVGADDGDPATESYIRCRSRTREETLERAEPGSIESFHFQVKKRRRPTIPVSCIEGIGDFSVGLFSKNARH